MSLAVLLAATVGCENGDGGSDRVTAASPLVRYEPPTAVLVREGTIRGDGGPIGQQGVPTVLRTFRPQANATLDAIVANLDERARAEGLAVGEHRDGHCTVTGADDGQVVMVWRSDPAANEVRFRALYVFGDQPADQRCGAEAGPAL
jgi:hypothetical protein